MPPSPEPDPPREGGRAGRNVPVAIITGLALAAGLFGAVFWSPIALVVLVCAVAGVAQREMYAVLEERGYHPASVLGMVAGIVLMVGAQAGGAQALSFGLAMAVLGTFLWYLAEPERELVAANIGATLLGIVYVPFLAAHVMLIRSLPHGAALAIAVLGAAAVYDIGAYASGSIVGRHKMAPRVSPGKTWEGAFGATLVLFVIALSVGPHIGSLGLGPAAALAGITCVAAPLGDLAESLIKRDLEVKDMGRLLPGHGGLLDRIDGMLFVAPAAYWLLRAVV